MGTTTSSIQILKTGEVTRVMWLKTAMAWYALTPEHDERYIPQLALKNGIQLDSIKKGQIILRL